MRVIPKGTGPANLKIILKGIIGRNRTLSNTGGAVHEISSLLEHAVPMLI